MFEKTWGWIKAHAEWVYALIILGLAGQAYATGDNIGGTVCVGIAVVLFGVLRWARRSEGTPPPVDFPALTYEQGEVELIKSLGVEPVPIPGEEHDEASCTYCQFMKGGYR